MRDLRKNWAFRKDWGYLTGTPSLRSGLSSKNFTGPYRMAAGSSVISIKHDSLSTIFGYSSQIFWPNCKFHSSLLKTTLSRRCRSTLAYSRRDWKTHLQRAAGSSMKREPIASSPKRSCFNGSSSHFLLTDTPPSSKRHRKGSGSYQLFLKMHPHRLAQSLNASPTCLSWDHDQDLQAKYQPTILG